MNEKYALTNAIILDGTAEMKETIHMAVLVNGSKIEKIVPDSHDLTGYKIVDLSGKYLMPGLINLHVHLPGSGKPKKKQSDAAKTVKLVTSNGLFRKVTRNLCAKYAKTELLSGVTTIRTVGGILNFDTEIRNQINAGTLLGPRILAANMAVSVPGGHMAGSLGYAATTPESAAAYVETIAKDNPDLIKLMITGGVLDATVKGEPGVLKMPPELVRAACDKAHALHLPVAAHVESPEGVKVALENGVDTIEHGAKPDAEILRLFKEKGAKLITTISPSLPFALFDPEISHATELSHFNGKIVMEGIIDCARACLEAGIPVGLGTDTACPYITHYDMWRELYYFSKFCHVTPSFALHTATLGNAMIAGIDKETGSIEEGKSADMIVTTHNPLQTPQALRHIEMVICRGTLISSPPVKKMAKVENELDKFL